MKSSQHFTNTLLYIRYQEVDKMFNPIKMEGT